MSFLSIRHLQVACKGNLILNDFSLEVNEGCIYALIGPSGCGKSTLLKTICGIIPHQEGELLLKNEQVDPARHTLGYIPQTYGLLDWLTVAKNMSIGEKLGKHTAADRDLIIDQLEMREWLDRYPRELSGGQQQRAALARAWMLKPDLLLMDEPFSSLDTFTAERSRELFLKLWRKQKLSSLLVTHNLQEALRLGKYIVLLSRQPAEVLEIIENPLFDADVEAKAADLHLFESEIKNTIRLKWEEGI